MTTTKIKSEMWLVPLLTAVLCMAYRLHHFANFWNLWRGEPTIAWGGVFVRALTCSLLFGVCAILCRRVMSEGAPLRKGLALATFAVGTAGFITAYHLIHSEMGWSELLLRAFVSSVPVGVLGMFFWLDRHRTTKPSTAQRIGLFSLVFVLELTTGISVIASVYGANIGEVLQMTCQMIGILTVLASAFALFCAWFFFAEKLSAKYE